MDTDSIYIWDGEAFVPAPQMLAKLAHYREVLEFYADWENTYNRNGRDIMHPPIITNGGRRARDALAKHRAEPIAQPTEDLKLWKNHLE